MKIKSKRILVVSSKFPPKEYSGSGFRAYNTYSRLNKKYGLSWDAVVNSQLLKGNEHYYINKNKIYRISSPFKVMQNNFIFKNLEIILNTIWETIFVTFFFIKNEKKYNLLHTFGNSWSIGLFTLFFHFKKKPVIREIVNDVDNPFYPIQIAFLIKKVFRKKNLIIAISKKIEKLCKINKVQNIWQRCNPIDENKFYIDYKNKLKFRTKLTNFKKKDIVLCYVASLLNRKNQLFLLKVLKDLPPRYKLVICGPVNYSELYYSKKISKMIKELKLEKRVQYQKKFIKNIDQYIKLSDLYVMPTLSEGFGTTVLETQACGVPIVTTLLKDITSNYVIDGKGGYKSSLHDKEFVKKINLSLKIPKKVLINNAELVKKRYSTKIIDEKYYQKINKLLEL